MLLMLMALPSHAFGQTLSDYEDWKAKQQQSAVGAAGVVIGSQEQTPDQLAGDPNLAPEFGKATGNPVPPASMAGEYRSMLQDAVDKRRAERIVSPAPRLTEWLRNLESEDVARNDPVAASWIIGALASAAIVGVIILWRTRRAIMRAISDTVVALGAGAIIAVRKIVRAGANLRSAMINLADKHDGKG